MALSLAFYRSTILTCFCCLRFPASANPGIFAAQKTLVEAWTIIEDAYVDAHFGGNDWEGELSEALVSAYTADTSASAYHQIGTMLEKLGDPFTRIVPPSYAPHPSSLCPIIFAHNAATCRQGATHCGHGFLALSL